jgi:DNA mismatch repair protein MutL
MVMSKIRILPDRVANQIAAGEVVERPAAVVKELIENSIDAGANKIEIEFRNGGKSYLRVEDDGVGMDPDQALLCLERHATSKIRKASDLDEIQTFGFRGEALPSISSVSRFTLRSRAKNSSEGNEILINGGKMIHVKECGMPQGTRIEVAHLFNSVPGRRKFLKTEVTESSHIIHLAKLYALAHPKITFSLIEGARTLFRSPACENLIDRVREIFGKSLSECLAPIEVQTEGMNLGGLL